MLLNTSLRIRRGGRKLVRLLLISSCLLLLADLAYMDTETLLSMLLFSLLLVSYYGLRV